MRDIARSILFFGLTVMLGVITGGSSTAATVEGFVREYRTHLPISDVKVVLKNLRGNKLREVTSNQMGRFSFDNIEAGQFILNCDWGRFLGIRDASSDNHSVFREFSVREGDRLTTFGFELLPPAEIHVTIRSAEGEPLGGSTAYLQSLSEVARPDFWIAEKADSLGKFTFSRLGGGRYYLAGMAKLPIVRSSLQSDSGIPSFTFYPDASEFRTAGEILLDYGEIRHIELITRTAAECALPIEFRDSNGRTVEKPQEFALRVSGPLGPLLTMPNATSTKEHRYTWNLPCGEYTAVVGRVTGSHLPVIATTNNHQPWIVVVDPLVSLSVTVANSCVSSELSIRLLGPLPEAEPRTVRLSSKGIGSILGVRPGKYAVQMASSIHHGLAVEAVSIDGVRTRGNMFEISEGRAAVAVRIDTTCQGGSVHVMDKEYFRFSAPNELILAPIGSGASQTLFRSGLDTRGQWFQGVEPGAYRLLLVSPKCQVIPGEGCEVLKDKIVVYPGQTSRVLLR